MTKRFPMIGEFEYMKSLAKKAGFVLVECSGYGGKFGYKIKRHALFESSGFKTEKQAVKAFFEDVFGTRLGRVLWNEIKRLRLK